METMVIKKGNWSGETAEIKAFKNKVCLYGVCGQEKWEDFKIKHYETDEGFKHFTVSHEDYSLAPIVLGHIDSGIWYAQASVQRCSPCLYTAIAQVLYNIL